MVIFVRYKNFRKQLNKSSAVAEMGDHLATIDMGRKVGERLLCPYTWGSWISI